MNYSLKRRIISFILYYLGISWVFLKFNKQVKQLHFYGHRVLYPDSKINKFFINTGHAITANDFKKKINFLNKNFTASSILKIDKKNYSNFTISFDDGYVDNLNIAYPIANKNNIPIHIFVTTGLIQNKFSFWPDKLGIICFKLNGKYNLFNVEYSFNNENDRINSYLNLCKIIKNLPLGKIDIVINEIINITKVEISQIELSSLYITPELIKNYNTKISFGAHTEKHENLTKIGIEKIKKTINGSISLLEKLVNKKINTFAYPYGFYNIEVLDFIKSEYPKLICFSTGVGNTTSNLDISRINLNISPFYLFHVETSGVFNWLKKA